MPAKKKVLNTPIVQTQNATEVELSGFSYDAVENRLEIKYMLILDDGTPFKRGREMIRDEAEITAFFTAVKANSKDTLEAIEDQMFDTISGILS